jgi:hypothetical protein
VESGAINGASKIELYQRDEKGSNFSGNLVPIPFVLALVFDCHPKRAPTIDSEFRVLET